MSDDRIGTGVRLYVPSPPQISSALVHLGSEPMFAGHGWRAKRTRPGSGSFRGAARSGLDLGWLDWLSEWSWESRMVAAHISADRAILEGKRLFLL
jgi:hypothetical protein